MGQFRPVIIKRVLVADTIETRIVMLQEKKKLLFKGTVCVINVRNTKRM
jgi:DNA repair protein RAD16